jgi:phage gp29-like protein
MINKGDTYDDIVAAIITAYPSIDMRTVEQLMQKAIYVNDLWGGANAR